MDPFIFISYAPRDRAVADAVCARIEASGTACWISPRDVHGVDSRDAAIQHAAAVLVIFSRAANVARQVRDDVAAAIDKPERIITARIDDSEPTGALRQRLDGAEWVDLPKPVEAHLDALVERVAGRGLTATSNGHGGGLGTLPDLSAGSHSGDAVPEATSRNLAWHDFKPDFEDDGDRDERPNPKPGGMPHHRRTALIAAGVIALLLIVVGMGLSLVKRPLLQQASNTTSNSYYPPEQGPTAPVSGAGQPGSRETETASLPGSAATEPPAPSAPAPAPLEPAPPALMPSIGSTEPTAPITDNPPGARMGIPGAPVRVFTGDTDTVDALAFSPDGRLLLSGSDDHTVRLWDVVSGRDTKIPVSAAGRIVTVAYAPHGDIAAWSSTGSNGDGNGRPAISLWDVTHRRALPGLTLPAGGREAAAPTSLAFSPDERLISAGSDDGTIRLWDIEGRKVLQSWAGHKKGVLSIAFSPDGKLLASGGGDGVVRLWDASTGEAVRTLSGHTRWVRSVVFSPDGSLLASGSEDKTIRLWDVASGEAERILKGHSRWVRSVAFTPDGHTLISGGQDNTIKLWNVADGREIRTLKGHEGPVFSVAVSPQGSVAASGGADQTIRLWNLTTIEEAGR